MKYPLSTLSNIAFNIVGFLSPAWYYKVALNLLGLASGIFHFLEDSGHKYEWAFQKADIICIYLTFILMTTQLLDIHWGWAVPVTAIIGWLHVTKGWFDSFIFIPIIFALNTYLYTGSYLYVIFFLIASLFGHSTLINLRYDIRHSIWHVFSALGFYFWL